MVDSACREQANDHALVRLGSEVFVRDDVRNNEPYGHDRNSNEQGFEEQSLQV
jgi:hypothetical protein